MNLTGQFLIAMPSMQDPYFSKTVIYICTHNADGAMGLVINRPMDITLDHVFNQIDLSPDNLALNNTPVYTGGPVQAERGFMLHETGVEYDATIVVDDNISLTSSKDILAQTANNAGPEKILFALGYAGWTEGQLENEMLQNAWLSVQAEPANTAKELIFDLPDEEKLNAAMAQMGVDLASLSEVAGHA